MGTQSSTVVPGESSQGEHLKQQLWATEEKQDAVHDGFQAEHVGLQQQVIGGQHGRWEGQGHTDAKWHLSLAEVSLCTCQIQPIESPSGLLSLASMERYVRCDRLVNREKQSWMERCTLISRVLLYFKSEALGELQDRNHCLQRSCFQSGSHPRNHKIVLCREKFNYKAGCWWLTPVIPATWETEIRRI
jgi:hypothetical protein